VCIYYKAYAGPKPPNHSYASVCNRSNNPHPFPNLGRSGHSGFRRCHTGTLSPSLSLRFPPPPPPNPIFNADPWSTSPGAQEMRRAPEMHLARRVRWHQGTLPDALAATRSTDPHCHTPSEPLSRDVSQRPLCALHHRYATSDALHIVSMDIIRSWGGGPPPNWPRAAVETSRRHAPVLPPPPHVDQEMNHNRHCKWHTVTVVTDCSYCCNFEGGTTTLIHPGLDLRRVGWGWAGSIDSFALRCNLNYCNCLFQHM
jgi:hypothetical protein